jgi:DNA polymerase-3 subunit epsilon
MGRIRGIHEENRSDVQQWAKEVLADPDTVILYCETSTHPDANPEIIEVGLVSGRGEVLHQELFHPVDPIAPDATAVHGLTDSDVKYARDFWNDGGYQDLVRLLRGRRIIAFQIAFEQKLISGEDWATEEEVAELTAWWSTSRWECAQQAYQRWLGVDHPTAQPGSLHRAIPDCYATLSLLHMLASTDPGTPPTFSGANREATTVQVDWIHDLLFELHDRYHTKTARRRRITELTGHPGGNLSKLSTGEASHVIDSLKEEIIAARIATRSEPITSENKTALNARLSGIGIPRGPARYRFLETILAELGVPGRTINSSSDLTEGEFGPVMDRLRADSTR